jgi:uncharacterized protein (DUF486 family)
LIDDDACLVSPQVSVVQPVAGCGLAILCVFSHFYLKEVMNGLDWIAITLAGVGTIGELQGSQVLTSFTFYYSQW